jgi:hypothetical protein
MIGIGTLLAVIGVLAAVAWIFSTTPAGQAAVERLGLRALAKGAAPKEDRDYLLRVSGGDRSEVERLLDAEYERYPEMSEAQAHRRAIRTHFAQKGRDEGDA